MKNVDLGVNLEEKKSEYDENGVIILKNFIEKDLMERVLGEWESFHDSKKDSKTTTEEPLVVFWRHVIGEKKKLRPISEFPAIRELAFHPKICGLAKALTGSNDIRLLETIIFNKPPQKSNQLYWHQDVAYFPFDPNNQVAYWIPLDDVDADNGTLEYVLGSHKEGLMGSVDLHSGEKFKGEDRPIIPRDPVKEGWKTEKVVLKPGDITLHDGLTWHRSGPNKTQNRNRRGLSLRYLVGETEYRPRAGSAATFIGQVEVQPGDLINGPAFPTV